MVGFSYLESWEGRVEQKRRSVDEACTLYPLLLDGRLPVAEGHSYADVAVHSVKMKPTWLNSFRVAPFPGAHVSVTSTRKYPPLMNCGLIPERH